MPNRHRRDLSFAERMIRRLIKWLEPRIKPLVKWLKPVKRVYKDLTLRYPASHRKLVITLIYLCAIVNLLYGSLNYLLRYYPTPVALIPFQGTIDWFADNIFLAIFTIPLKSFFVLELVFISLSFGKPDPQWKLVQHHFLICYISSLMSSELIQLWKIICHRDLPELAEKWIASDKMPLLTIDTTVAFPVFMVIILFSLFFYIYLYVQAMKGKFGYIRGMEWLFDSVSFWLQIRTPTMKGFGGGKIKGKGKGGKRK